MHSYGCVLGVLRGVCIAMGVRCGGVEGSVHSYGCTLGVLRCMCA